MEFCIWYVLTRFSNREATVIGPTPPGTGEMACNMFGRSILVSPTTVPFTTEIPTSTTIWPAVMCASVMIPGAPAATTIMSAVFV